VSKLSTWRDGFRILSTIVGLYRSERPLACLSGLGIAPAIVSVGLAVPIFVTYFEQGIVPRIPTTIFSTGLMLLASLSIVAGLVLDTGDPRAPGGQADRLSGAGGARRGVGPAAGLREEMRCASSKPARTSDYFRRI
jgi:hypothetical protein